MADDERCSLRAISQLQATSDEATDLSSGERLRRHFIAALNEQTEDAWQEVLVYCSSLSVLDREELSSHPDILHYVQRCLEHAERSRNLSELLGPLTTLLPEAVDYCRREGHTRGHHLSQSTIIPKTRPKKKARKRVVSLDSGLQSLLSYSPKQIATTFRGPQLQLSDVLSAASNVSDEIAQHSKGAMSPFNHLPPTVSITSPPSSQQHKPLLSPVYNTETDTNVRPSKGAKRKIKFEEGEMHGKGGTLKGKLTTAFDVIEAFASGRLQAGAESVYLNPTLCSPWNPYSLTVVPKTRANPEHYIISKFGILHVQPCGDFNLQILVDWLREAGLFSLCQQIPFFKHFLARKMFRCWYHNVTYQQFRRLRAEVDRVGLRYFSEFRGAINQVHRLNRELVNFPGLTHTVMGGYLASVMEKTSEENEAKIHRLLQRYFKYCRRVTSEAVRITQEKVEELEEEKKHQPFVSDSPISVQVAQHAELERKLSVARYRASRLTNFVTLVEQMMSSCLLEKARQSAEQWVQDILLLKINSSQNSLSRKDEIEGYTTEQLGSARGENTLLMVDLKISEKGGVVIQPNIEKIVHLLSSPLLNIITLLSSTCTTATGIPAKTQPSSVKPVSNNDRDLPMTNVMHNKPLIQILKGINVDSKSSRTVPESSRARSRLDEVQGQLCSQVHIREDYSTVNSPLIPHNMENKLEQDPVMNDWIGCLQEALAGLEDELSTLCQNYHWLDNVSSLIEKCKKDKIENMSAENFEMELGELHSALSRVSHLPPFLFTSNSLATVSTQQVTSLLEPQLHQALSKLQTAVAAQAFDAASQLLRDAQLHTQLLLSKRYDLEGFVQYARSLAESQAFHRQEAPSTRRAVDIHTTLRKYNIPVSAEAREVLQRLQEVWSQFEIGLKEGEEFVRKQTPIKAQGLQDSIVGLEEQLEQLVGLVSCGEYIDPSASPQSLLFQLESVLEEMSTVRSRLMELSKWEEAITGKHHNLSQMFHCFDKLYARQELWKYRRQFDSCDYDWSHIPFRKLDMAYIEQKVCEWWDVCDKLAEKLSFDDPVLEEWRERVEKMHINMPTLKLLASRDIQTSHWHTIFAGFNEQYDPRQNYTLNYFLEREPSKFSDLINKVYWLASQQSRLREKFLLMGKTWETKIIQLRRIPAERYAFCLVSSGVSQRHTTITFQDSPDTQGKGHPETDREQLQSVEGGDELEQEIEAAMLEMDVILSSPHAGRLKKRVELLCSNLNRVKELFHLLLSCQNQWKDLVELFLNEKPSTRKSLGLHHLQLASSHLREIIVSVNGDPRLFSLLSKGRGRKGVRDLQGPELKNKLSNILQHLGLVMDKLGSRFDEVELQWPRLGYLTQSQKLKAIACRGDPVPIIPLINILFPSIETIHYIEATFTSDKESYQGYQVTGVEGELGEVLSLVIPLPLERRPAVEWLAGLEQAIKFSLASHLTDCLNSLPHDILTGQQPLDSDRRVKVVRWLDGHVEQNILLTMDIYWSNTLSKSLFSIPSSIHNISSQIKSAMENTVELLQWLHQQDQRGRQRVIHVLRSIIIYLKRKSDFVDTLLRSDDPQSMWQFHIHYSKESASPVARSVTITPAHSTTTLLENSQKIRPPSSQLSAPSRSTTPRSSSSYKVGEKRKLHISQPTQCYVHSMDSAVSYGFEYYSPGPQVVMTPAVESTVTAIIAGSTQHSVMCVSGEENTVRVSQAAQLMGRHHHLFTCCHLTSAGFLLHLLHTAVSSGPVLSLAQTHNLPISVQLKTRNYIHTLQQTLASVSLPFSNNKASDEDLIPLTPSGCPRIVSSRLDWYSTLPTSPPLQNSISLDHMGKTLSINSNFVCCVSLHGDRSNKLNYTALTMIACREPDLRLTIEVLLFSHGFSSAYNLSKLLMDITFQLKTQMNSVIDGQFSNQWLQKIVEVSASIHYNNSSFENNYAELEVAGRALLEVTTPLISNDEISTLKLLVSQWLLKGKKVEKKEEEEKELIEAVEEVMKERQLQIMPEIKAKIIQLHQSIEQYRCLLLLGPRRSGISTSFSTLASAYVQMGRPPIAVTVLNPAAYSWEQMFGGYWIGEDGREQWSNGILSRLLLHINRSSSSHWVILDGPLSPSFLDTITTLISANGLCLPGAEKVIKIPTNCRLLIKPGPLPTLSPGLVASCGLLHWSSETVTQEMLVDTWLDRAPTQHDLTHMSISYLANVLQNMVPESLDYLNTVCSKHYGPEYRSSQAQQSSSGVAETRTLLSLLSALLERNCPTKEGSTTYSGYGSRSSSSLRSASVAGSISSSRCGSAVSQVSSTAEMSSHQLPPLTPRDDFTPEHGLDFSFSQSNLDSIETQILSILTFAFIWSIGAYIPFSELESFNEFAIGQINDLPMSVSFPDEGSVFDYYLDLRTYRFEPWSKRKGRLSPKANGYIPTTELSRVAYIVEVYLSHGLNVILLGEKGSGKTSLIENLLQTNLSMTKFPVTTSLTGPQLHSAFCRKAAEVSRVDKLRWGSRKVGNITQNCLFFIDDLHFSFHDSPDNDLRKSSSLSQLVLLASRHRSLSAFPDDTTIRTNNIQYLVSSLAGHQYTKLNHLLGYYHPVPLFPLSDQALATIFSTSVELWFKKFPSAAIGDTENLARALSVASVAVHRSVCSRLCPSASHPEWFISLRHFIDVFQGLLLMPLDSKTTLTGHFAFTNRRVTPSTAGKSSSRRTSDKSAKKSSRILSSYSRRGTARTRSSAVHLPPVKKENNSLRLRSKIESELKGKQQQPQHDVSEIQATLHRLIRMWCHENTRVYADRMSDNRDRSWFVQVLETCVKYCFCGVRFEQAAATTGRGGRPGRRGRGVSMAAQQNVGLNFNKLVADGVKADVLQTLMPPRIQPADTDSNETNTIGELIPLNQVITRGEDVTALIFCKLPAVRVARRETSSSSGDESEEASDDEQKDSDEDEDTLTDSVYQELGDGQVLETMEKHLAAYDRDNSSSAIDQTSNIILFQQAMEHATRLLRSLMIPGCHSCLLGVAGSGRKSLCTLVTYMIGGKLFQFDVNDEGGMEVLKKACLSAATVSSTLTVLLISSAGPCKNQALWSNVLQIMTNGDCIKLFTQTELIRIQNILKREQHKKTVSPQAIARLVHHNLHIVVTWDINRLTHSPIISTSKSGYGTDRFDPGLNEGVTQDIFSSLCNQCSVVDYYEPWGRRELGEVSQKWWRDKTQSLQRGWITSESQLESLADLATHIHLSSLTMMESDHIASLLLSPASFTTLLCLTHSIAVSLRETDRGREERVSKAIENVESGEEGRKILQGELAALQSQLREIEAQLEEKERSIQDCQQRYKMASQEWTEAKKTITSSADTVKNLRSTLAEKMQQVSSLHLALECLPVTKNDVMEMMGYREPPSSAILVFNSICLLFDRPQTWEDCKLLLMSPNFFESLAFFDKDNISRHKLCQLREMINAPQWKMEDFPDISKAVSSLAEWVSSLLDYHRARDILRPTEEELASSEEILTKAELTLVAKRKVMTVTKLEFKHALKKRSNISKQKMIFDTKVSLLEKRLDQANRLLSSLSTWRSLWEEEKGLIHCHILSLPGHAVLTAASVLYLPRVPAVSHARLWDCWLGYCRGELEIGSTEATQSHHHHHHLSSSHQIKVQIETDFSPITVLSEKEERASWNHHASFPDQAVLDRCLAARKALEMTITPHTLIMDPHQVFSDYVHELEFYNSQQRHSPDSNTSLQHRPSHKQKISCVETVRLSDIGWNSTLSGLEKTEKAVILILDTLPSTTDRENLRDLLVRRQREKDSQSLLSRLYLVMEERVRETVPAILKHLGLKMLDFTVVDMGLSQRALDSHLLKFVLRLDHPEYAARHRALLVDHTFHEQQIAVSKEKVISAVLEAHSLLEQPDIIDLANEGLAIEISAQENIRDTEKALEKSRSLVNDYRPLSFFFALVITEAQHLCKELGYPTISLAVLQKMMTGRMSNRRHERPPDDPAACQEHVLQLQKDLMMELYSKMKRSMLHRHCLLLPLMVEIAHQLAKGEMSFQEYTALRSQENLHLNETDTGSKRPEWMSQEAWMGAHLLERLPLFEGLVSSLVNDSELWREYLQHEVSLTSVIPLPTQSPLNNFLRVVILLTKLRPEKFTEVVEEYVGLRYGEMFTARHSVQDSIDYVLSLNKEAMTILTEPEGDEERIAEILRESARERSLLFHHVELIDASDIETALKYLPNKEGGGGGGGGWLLLSHCHLLDQHPPWSQLTQAIDRTSCQLWITVPWTQIDLVDPSWPHLVLEDSSCSNKDHNLDILDKFKTLLQPPPAHFQQKQ